MSLELRDVSRSVDSSVYIHPTSVTLTPGGFNILLGPTLAGKTSLMRLMAGLDKPTTGQIFFAGEDVTGMPVQKRKVAMVYQQFVNYPAMTVFQNIASPLRLNGESTAAVRKRVDQIAELLKLGPLLDRLPSELSGGQQQRTALARALAKNASLVLLDEPLANLDYKLREELREELPRLFENSGATVVYATTEPGEALLLSGNTAALNEGRITQFGPTHTVFRNPNDLLTAVIFSDPPLNLANARKEGSTFQLGFASWPVGHYSDLPDGDYQVGFRPHHLQLQSNNESELQISGGVLITEISGSESFVHLGLGEYRWVAQVHGVYQWDPGQKVDMFLSSANLLVFDSSGSRIRMEYG